MLLIGFCEVLCFGHPVIQVFEAEGAICDGRVQSGTTQFNSHPLKVCIANILDPYQVGPISNFSIVGGPNLRFCTQSRQGMGS